MLSLPQNQIVTLVPSQELGRIGLEIGNVKTDLCKALETIDHKLDTQLTLIEQKIGSLEKSQQEYNKKKDQLQLQFPEVGKKEKGLEKALEVLGEDHRLLENDVRET